MRRLHPVYRALDFGELGADQLHLLHGDGDRLGQLACAVSLPVGLVFERADLVGPGLDLALPLHQDFRDLGAAALHVGDATVENLHLLPTFGEFEAGLGKSLPLHVALGAQGEQLGVEFVDAGATGLHRALGFGELLPGAFETRVRLVAGGFELLQFALHAVRPLADLFHRAKGVALLLLHGGVILRGFEHLGALFLQALLGFGETVLQRIDNLPLTVMRELIVGERGGGLAQVDLALHQTAAAGFFSKPTEDHSARIHQFALGGGDRQKPKIRVGPPVGQKHR